MTVTKKLTETLKGNLNEILTLYEAAHELKVSEKTLWNEARAGRVPHFKVGKQYRFLRSELLEWAKGF